MHRRRDNRDSDAASKGTTEAGKFPAGLVWPELGRIPTILDRPPGRDHTLERMRKSGLTVDRENYIWAAYGADPPEWGPELEAELPEELQDVTRDDTSDKSFRKL